MNNSLAARALAAAAIALVILVPIQLIKGKVGERQARAEGVIKQFANETGRAQVVAGPFLAITCDEDCPTLYFTPKELKASATLAVETVHRGIYPIRLYNADITLSGQFEWPALPPDTQARKWKHGYLVVAVSDARGIKVVKSSLPSGYSPPDESTLSHFAIREDLGQAGTRKAGTLLPFSYRLSLLGTTSLQVLPIGDETEIRMGSGWRHPSFSEAWSPSERRVSRDGFEATWRITGLATGGRAKWQDVARSRAVADTGGAGVTLFDPVNVYSLSYRATEYAFLFVLFTFCALALTEAIAGVRLHPVQYALTGSAIAVFFLLLLALSEHVSFGQAYAIAAGACIALLTYYLRHPLGTSARTAAFFALFMTLYGSLYGLLESEDNALLMGSLMVFALLAFTMVATRKMDWGAIAARSAPQG